MARRPIRCRDWRLTAEIRDLATDERRVSTNGDRHGFRKLAGTADFSRKPEMAHAETGPGWLGRNSNLRMAESKSAALPLGYAPKRDWIPCWRRQDSDARLTDQCSWCRHATYINVCGEDLMRNANRPLGGAADRKHHVRSSPRRRRRRRAHHPMNRPEKKNALTQPMY